MDGAKAQGILLTTFGNRWLRGPTSNQPGFPGPDTSCFRGVERVTFTYESGSNKGSAGDPAQWLAQLRERGVRRLWFVVEAPRTPPPGRDAGHERYTAGFVGGGTPWQILGVGPQHTEKWVAEWQVGNEAAKDQRIWRVKYRGLPVETAAAPRVTNVPDARLRLERALVDARELAQTVGGPTMDLWAKQFEAARALALQDEPMLPYYAEMVPPDFPKASRQLLCMAASANVFAGMGSWNDLAVEERYWKRYDEVSARLYAAMLDALSAAANGDDGE